MAPPWRWNVLASERQFRSWELRVESEDVATMAVPASGWRDKHENKKQIPRRPEPGLCRDDNATGWRGDIRKARPGRPLRGVAGLPAEGGHQPQFTDFLIDICRLEIDASCTKHRMAMHSNRHSCGASADGAADTKSKSRSLVGQNRASVGMTTRRRARGDVGKKPPGLIGTPVRATNHESRITNHQSRITKPPANHGENT
jgi:hypothetical protein